MNRGTRGRKDRILELGRSLYPDLAPRMLVWRNRGKHFVAGTPPHDAVLGYRETPGTIALRPLRFASTWVKLLADLEHAQKHG